MSEALPLLCQSRETDALLLTGSKLHSSALLQHQKPVLKAKTSSIGLPETQRVGQEEGEVSLGGEGKKGTEYMHPHVKLWQTAVWFIIILPLVTLT